MLRCQHEPKASAVEPTKQSRRKTEVSQSDADHTLFSCRPRSFPPCPATPLAAAWGPTGAPAPVGLSRTSSRRTSRSTWSSKSRGAMPLHFSPAPAPPASNGGPPNTVSRREPRTHSLGFTSSRRGAISNPFRRSNQLRRGTSNPPR
jgi:hypothetical protein